MYSQNCSNPISDDPENCITAASQSHRSLFALSFVLLSLIACQPNVQAASSEKETKHGRTAVPALTATAASTETPQPTDTPELPTITPCSPGALNVYSPLNASEDLGEIDGYRFVEEADQMEGKRVRIQARVLEAQHQINPEAGVDGTLMLVEIKGLDQQWYPVAVHLPDKGLGVSQFSEGTVMNVSGIHLGYINIGMDALVPALVAEMAVAVCVTT